MKKQLLLIAATHGDEKIGVETIKILENRGYEKYFDILIANPEALKRKRRFIDVDLNRSYPGDKNSRLYEQKLAYNNLKTARNYKYIIDMHEANEGKDDFIIIPRKTLSRKFPLQHLDLKKILLWPSPSGPVGNILSNAVELEFGMKNINRQQTANRCAGIIENFIKNIYSLGETKSYGGKKVYYVYGKLLAKNFNSQKTLIDFQKTKIEGEIFYPLLTNQYIKDGIIYYKMKPSSNYSPLSHP